MPTNNGPRTKLGYDRHPLILEEGQRCKYTERRSQFSGFYEEAIGQLLCSPGHDFALSVAGRQVRIMCTSMTTLT